MKSTSQKKSFIPINKGNYSLDSKERESKFEEYRGEGWADDYKLYRENWHNYPKKQYVSEYPQLVDIELSSVCNLHCPMCYTISDEFKEKVNTTRMDWDLYTKLIDEIGGKVPAVRLSLRGEATLHKKFLECIQYAKSKGIKEVSTLTHGRTLNLEFAKKIIEAGIDWITISIDGIDDTYERIRKPIKFNELVKNITDIHNYKLEKNLHKPVIKIQGIWPAIRDDLEEYYKIFSKISDLVAFNPLIDYLFKDKYIDYIENFACPQQYQRLVIGADGLVMKCSNDEENIEVVGDVNKSSVYDVWHGKKMNAVRELHKRNGFMESEVCKRCYLPRTTENETAYVDGREFIVKNYVFRTQEIGF